MRYNDRIVLTSSNKETYNPELGEYEQEIPEKITVPCYVMDLNIEKSMQIFGDYKQDRKECFVKRPIGKSFDTAIYNGRKYKTETVAQKSTVFYLIGDDSIE